MPCDADYCQAAVLREAITLQVIEFVTQASNMDDKAKPGSSDEPFNSAAQYADSASEVQSERIQPSGTSRPVGDRG